MIRFGLAAAVASLALAGLSAPAGAQAPVRVGSLECNISGGIGMIIASQKQIDCTFLPASNGPPERYRGMISKFGLDLGATTGARMVWIVYAPTAAYQSLGGTYAGATAEATFGAGLGANVLIGGSNNTIALQPLSIQGQSGLNLAVGVADLRLGPAN